MTKFSHLGAAALALALSVTLVTPTTALAAKPASIVDLDKQGNDSIGYTENINVVGEYSDANYNKVTQKIVDAGLAAGWLTEVAEYDDCDLSLDIIDGEDYTEHYYKLKDGYSLSPEANHEYKNGLFIRKVTSTTYVNNSTNATSTDKDKIYDKAAQQKFVSGVRVKVGEISYLKVQLKNGDVNITNVKSSKKKIVTAKRFTAMDSVTTTNDTVDYEIDENKNKYYYTSAGDKVILANDDAVKASNNSSATVYIKLTAKKAGKSKLSFNIVNTAGVVTGSVSTTLYSVSDADVFKTYTYAGKSLLDDYSNTNNLNYGKKLSDTTYNVATKKSGKLVVKTNKNYVVKNIEIGTLYTEPRTAAETNEYWDYNATGLTTDGHKVDLNGDGDTLDTVNGISESNVTYRFTKTKSGKKIKLGKVGEEQSFTASRKEKLPADSTLTPIEYSRKYNGYNLYAPTLIKVTYYDKLSKTYGVDEREIYLRVKK